MCLIPFEVFVCLCFLVPTREDHDFRLTETLYVPADNVKVHGKTVLTLFTTTLTWNDASDACRRMFAGQAGTLAKPDNLEATTVIKNLLKGLLGGAWIGLYWEKAEDNKRLRWSDVSCTHFDFRSFGQFAAAQDTYTANTYCYFVDQNVGQWYKDACSNKHYFICEYQDFTDCMYSTPPRSPQRDIFARIKTAFYLLDKGEANQESCTSECLKTTGCFLTSPSTHSCLMGVVEQRGRTWVKMRCYEGNKETQLSVEIALNSKPEPSECQQLNTSRLSTNTSSVSGKAHLAGLGDLGSYISNIVNTITVTTTSIQATTKTETTTITEYVTATLTTTSSASDDTETPTLSQATTAAFEVLDTWEVTSYSVQPTTIREMAVATIQTVTVSLFPCEDCTNVYIPPCLDATTVTMTTADGMSSLSTHWPCISNQTESFNTEILSCGFGDIVTETVTDTNFVIPTTTQIPAMRTISEMATETTTEGTREILSTAFSTNTDCGQTITTYLTTTITSCDVDVTELTDDADSDQSLDRMGISKPIKRLTEFNQTNQKPHVKTESNNSFSDPDNSTFISINMEEERSSIISELLLVGSELSKSRRMKESVPDNRTSAKISGFLACVFIGCVASSIVILDIPLLCGGLKVKFLSLSER